MPAASSTRVHALRGRRHRDAERLQHVGRSRSAGEAPVAMLGHPHPGSRHDERRAGGDVEGAGAPATGAAGVDQRIHIAAAPPPTSRAGARAPHPPLRRPIRPSPGVPSSSERSGPATPRPASPRRTLPRPRHRSVTGLPRGGPARGGSGMKRRRARGDRGGGRRPGKRRGSRGLLSIKTKSCDACLGGLRRLDSGGHESVLPRADPLRRHRVPRVAATGNGPDCAGRS